MTFITDETGLDTSNPIEMYRFFGSTNSYTYTSSNRAMTFHAPSATLTEVYKPIPINRSDIILGDVTDRNELKIAIPLNTTIVSDYVFDIAPCSDLTLEIYRQNGETGAFNLIFAGLVASFSLRNNQANLVCPSVFSNYMDSEFPNIYYQSMCNHVLYNSRCGADKTAFTVTGTIAAISSDGTITVVEAGTKPNDWFTPGEIITTNERRLIQKQLGDVLTINWPFRTLNVGDPVTMLAGCDHSIQTCDTKFNVKDNFLGWPYIPYINPFVVKFQ